ncbi:uncharacterized protein L203_103792 [Cryptococcus depauperatus CBS 7841]|uniref:Uncharacterized protein n=1 Tax=Cryptococcus depauperatus CBS 7841 TaxID=1295531 RepID=A0AAJ8JU80_9TREE
MSSSYDSLKGKGDSKPQDGYKRASAYLKERGCPTLRTPSGIRGKTTRLHSDWISRRADAERDAMEWDILDLIFSDRDGGSVALRSDSTQSCNPVLRVLEDQPPNGPQNQLYASTGQSGFSQTRPSLSPSIQSPPRSLFAAQASPSQYYDSTPQVRRATRLETHSISDRHNGVLQATRNPSSVRPLEISLTANLNGGTIKRNTCAGLMNTDRKNYISDKRGKDARI